MNLYKFTHTPLLKNECQLKQNKKVTNNQKKKNQSPNLLKNENHVQLNKTKQNNYHAHNPGNQKKKKGKELDELPMCKCTSTFLSIKESHLLPSIFLTF